MVSKIFSVAITILISVLMLELMVRLFFGYPLWSGRDWRVGGISPVNNVNVVYDADLGWALRPFLNIDGFTTIEYGIRKNGSGPEALTQGAILAVGDSFTVGSEVRNEESWPAQLEALTKRRVLNAGAGGYGVDQIVMNAERLTPILSPQVIIVGLLDQDILRNSFSVYGAPKPYYRYDGASWKLEHSPVPPPRFDSTSRFKPVLARSAAIHLFASNLWQDWWYTGITSKSEFVKVDQGASSGQSACYLLLRLADKFPTTRMIMTMQYGGPFFVTKQKRGPHSEEVLDCVKGRYEVVDEYDTLHAIAERSIEELKSLYVRQSDGVSIGHMSAKGNAVIANLLFQKLQSSRADLPVR